VKFEGRSSKVKFELHFEFQLFAHRTFLAMSQRPSRVGEQIREDLTELLAREVHDPGVGFVTLTRVSVTADLQQARVYYTALGDDKAKRESKRALERAMPFLRRQLGRRLRLRRIPELQFFYDESIERGDRIERILLELEAERAASPPADEGEMPAAGSSQTGNDEPDDQR
jgi:ribosome-binding factor A